MTAGPDNAVHRALGRRAAIARSVNRQSVSAQVTDILRDMILTGELPPGEPMTHERISGLLNVSTMPVREALLRLTHEGLIEAHENRSFRVAVMTRDDIRDAYWLHETISAELAARASRRITPDQLDALSEITERPHRDDDGPHECYEFHGIVNAAAGAPRLVATLEQLTHLMPEQFYKRSSEWQQTTTASHKEIAKALERRDARAARKAMAKHIRDAAEFLIQYFTDHGFWERPSA
jgi:DNA-binding GntR family transcriptional regulator